MAPMTNHRGSVPPFQPQAFSDCRRVDVKTSGNYNRINVRRASEPFHLYQFQKVVQTCPITEIEIMTFFIYCCITLFGLLFLGIIWMNKTNIHSS